MPNNAVSRRLPFLVSFVVYFRRFFFSASDYWIDSTFRVLTFSKEGFRFFVICWSNFTLFNQSSKIAISWCLKRKLRFSAIKIDTLCLKITEKVSFAEFLKSWSLASNSVTRQVNFNWWKMPNFKNSNETFLDDFQTMCFLLPHSFSWAKKCFLICIVLMSIKAIVPSIDPVTT